MAKKQKLRKMRHDWIINNLYHKAQKEEMQKIPKIIFKKRLR